MVSSYFVVTMQGFDSGVQGGQAMLGQMEGLLAADCVIGQLVAPYFRMENFRLAPGHEIIMDCLKRRRQSLYAADVSRQRLSSRVVSAELGR